MERVKRVRRLSSWSEMEEMACRFRTLGVVVGLAGITSMQCTFVSQPCGIYIDWICVNVSEVKERWVRALMRVIGGSEKWCSRPRIRLIWSSGLVGIELMLIVWVVAASLS